MDWKSLILYSILGLGSKEARADAKERGYRKAPKAPPAAVAPDQAAQAPSAQTPTAAADTELAATAASPWATAAATVEAPITDRPEPAATDQVWTVEQDRAGRSARAALRGLVIVFLAFFCWVGVRAVFFSPEESTDLVLPAAVTFDQAAAQGVAARIVTVGMAWNEDDDPAIRLAAIEQDYAGMDSTLGWSGKGRQTVSNVTAGHVEVDLDGSTATVTVSAQVQAYTRESPQDDWATSGPSRWLTVAVPVAEQAGRIVVTGTPALVGAPAPEQTTRPAPVVEDAELTKATKGAAEAFFTAYAEGDVSAVESPGAAIPAPDVGWSVSDLSTWQVEQGTGDTRTAVAEVVWAITDDGLTTVRQSYAVTLTRVVAGGADRWQVSHITVSL